MKRILLWLLPVADVFFIRRIQAHYRKLGVPVPDKHMVLGLVERWIGYLPAGFVVGLIFGFWTSLKILLIAFCISAPPEFYLMARGNPPWRFFKNRPARTIAKIFLLEGYNAAGYYLLGAALGSLL